jgi:hypothetical protein
VRLRHGVPRTCVRIPVIFMRSLPLGGYDV